MEVVETKSEVHKEEEEEEEEEEESSKHKHELQNRLTADDLLLLAHFFYLPHQHGKRALQILNEFKWLKANSIKSDELSDEESAKKVWDGSFVLSESEGLSDVGKDIEGGVHVWK